MNTDQYDIPDFKIKIVEHGNILTDTAREYLKKTILNTLISLAEPNEAVLNIKTSMDGSIKIDIFQE